MAIKSSCLELPEPSEWADKTKQLEIFDVRNASKPMQVDDYLNGRLVTVHYESGVPTDPDEIDSKMEQFNKWPDINYSGE